MRCSFVISSMSFQDDYRCFATVVFCKKSLVKVYAIYLSGRFLAQTLYRWSYDESPSPVFSHALNIPFCRKLLDLFVDSCHIYADFF